MKYIDLKHGVIFEENMKNMRLIADWFWDLAKPYAKEKQTWQESELLERIRNDG